MDAVTTHVSWFSRLASSIKGVLGWVVLIIVGIGLLWWNEGRTVHTRKALDEGAKQVVSVQSFTPENDGKLIHYTQKITSPSPLTYEHIGFSEEEGLKLSIKWEVLQWIEEAQTKTQDNLGGSQTQTTTYSYKKSWTDDHVRSEEFAWPNASQYSNNYISPSQVGIKQNHEVINAMMGDFTLDASVFALLTNYDDFLPTPTMTEAIKKITVESLGQQYPHIQAKWSHIYIQQSQEQDTINDIRISFRLIADQTASVLWKQQSQNIGTFRASNNIDITRLDPGTHSAQEMFYQSHQENELLKWLLRVAGLAMIYGWWMMIFRPFVMLGKVVPLFGSLLEIGTWLISGLLTLIIGSLAIALAWMRFRPLVGILALIVTAWSIITLSYLKKKHKKQTTSSQKEDVVIESKY